LKIRSPRPELAECWGRVWRLWLQGELAWPEPPLAPEREKRELPSEQGQEPAVLPGPQWVERVQRRRGIRLRKPFP